MADKANYKQINYIKILAKQCNRKTRDEIDEIDFTTLTKWDASKLIDRLKKEVGYE